MLLISTGDYITRDELLAEAWKLLHQPTFTHEQNARCQQLMNLADRVEPNISDLAVQVARLAEENASLKFDLHSLRQMVIEGDFDPPRNGRIPIRGASTRD